jgi:hypothetical protein
MSRGWIAALIGMLLLGSAICLGRAQTSSSTGSRSRRKLPVDKLAEELKEAWSEHHTVA